MGLFDFDQKKMEAKFTAVINATDRLTGVLNKANDVNKSLSSNVSTLSSGINELISEIRGLRNDLKANVK